MAPMSRSSQQTSVELIEKAALEVFAEHGFASKNDIPFGNFPVLLDELEAWLATVPDDQPMFEVMAEAVLRFNRVHSDGAVAHRERMELIMHTPALRANAALRNADYLAALARFAARRMGEPVGSFGPQLVGHVAHGVSVAVYEQWLQDESSDLADLVHRGFAMVQHLAALEAAPSRAGARRR
jgi:hypothetical protein